MKKNLVLIFAIFTVFVFAGCEKNSKNSVYTIQKGVFKVGMDINYPPMEYYDSDGRTPIGFDVELARLLADKMDLQIEYVNAEWDTIFEGLDTNKYDAVISSVTITSERRKTMSFSQAYIGNAQSIVVRKDSDIKVSRPADLEGLTVGYQVETTSEYYMNDMAEAGLFFTGMAFGTVTQAYDALLAGECDAIMNDIFVSAGYLLQSSQYKMVWTGEADEYLGIAMKKNNLVLIEKVNEALDSLSVEGTLRALSKKFFNTDLIAVPM